MWGGRRSRLDQRALHTGPAKVRYPIALWVLLGLFVVVGFDVFVGGLLAVSLRRAGMSFDAARGLSYLVLAGLVALAFVVRWMQVRRVRRLIGAHGYLLCTKCHYPLSSEEERGRCPECSEWYQTADVISAWQEWESLQSTPVHGA